MDDSIRSRRNVKISAEEQKEVDKLVKLLLGMED